MAFQRRSPTAHRVRCHKLHPASFRPLGQLAGVLRWRSRLRIKPQAPTSLRKMKTKEATRRRRGVSPAAPQASIFVRWPTRGSSALAARTYRDLGSVSAGAPHHARRSSPAGVAASGPRGQRLMLNLGSLCETSGHSQRTAFGKPWRRLTICRQRIPRGSNHRHDSYHIG